MGKAWRTYTVVKTFADGKNRYIDFDGNPIQEPLMMSLRDARKLSREWVGITVRLPEGKYLVED